MQTHTAPTPNKGSVQLKRNFLADKEQYTVYLTYDYDKFKLMGDNRRLNLLHVRRLIESFNQKHLVSPIIINEKWEVIDGQHRLAASKEVGVPIYYVIIPKYGIKEVQILNTNQKNWQKIDYLHSYCAEGRNPYLVFKKFMDDFPELGMQPAERILTGVGTMKKNIEKRQMRMKYFEEGALNIPDINYSYSIAKKLMDIKPFFSHYNNGIFVSALVPLFKSKSYNHKEMLHKLSNCPIKLEKCADVEQYRKLIEDIYNYKRQKENKVSFRYE